VGSHGACTVTAVGRGVGFEIVASFVRAGRPADMLEPPEWEIPGLLSGEHLVTRSKDIVISAGLIQVFSTGLMPTFFVRFRPGSTPPAVEEFHLSVRSDVRGDRSPGPGDTLSLGALFSNGSPGEPEGDIPTMDLHAGATSPTFWRITYWIFPFPSDGLALSAKWPAHGIDYGRTNLARSDIRAARNAIEHLP